jgi:HSP20 family protein
MVERETSGTPVPVNIYRTEDRLMVAVAMPGLQPEDITVEVGVGGAMRILGALRGRLKDWKEVLVEEWQAGGYRRDLDLPAAVDASRGHATYENGVMVIVLPIAGVLVAGSFKPRPGQGH